MTSNTRPRKVARALLAFFGLALVVGSLVVAWASSKGARPVRDVPVLAYYYIWYDRGSWDRAKTDEPILGAYSSDSRRVMEQHVDWAKAAGIDGFVVSWKSTEKLDRRLRQLVDIATEKNFKLALIYQGLDFERNPLQVTVVESDLLQFAASYAGNAVFDLGGKPIVIWSGTWRFTRAEIERVSAAVRPSVRILASERDVDGLNRLGDLVDGDAYYWSSVDSTTPEYLEKLTAMSAVVHAHNGLWIAPVAAGFDARLVGGTRVISRDDGDHIRRQMEVIMEAHPDAIALISWNEFTENTHIEPSVDHGFTYVDVVRDSRGLAGLSEAPDDSSDFLPSDSAWIERLLAILVLLAVPIAAIGVIVRRSFSWGGNSS